MKLITPGKSQRAWRMTVTCEETPHKGCGAVLEVGREDVFLDHVGNRGEPETLASCFCVCCGTLITIGDARPFLMDLPTREDYATAHPEIVAKVAEDQAAVRELREAHRVKM